MIGVVLKTSASSGIVGRAGGVGRSDEDDAASRVRPEESAKLDERALGMALRAPVELELMRRCRTVGIRFGVPSLVDVLERGGRGRMGLGVCCPESMVSSVLLNGGRDSRQEGQGSWDDCASTRSKAGALSAQSADHVFLVRRHSLAPYFRLAISPEIGEERWVMRYSTNSEKKYTQEWEETRKRREKGEGKMRRVEVCEKKE